MASPEPTRTRTRGGRTATSRKRWSPDLTPAAHDLLQRAVEEAARLLESDGAIIYLLDPDEGILHFAHDAGIEKLSNRRWVRKLELQLGQGMFGVATAERRVVVTRDYDADTSFAHAEATDRFVREVGLRSMVVAPLAAADRTFGAMGAFSRRADAFNDAQIALIRSLADHAAAAIANALLIDELAESRTKLERQAEAEQALREIAMQITAIRDPDEILQKVIDAAKRLLRATGGMLDLVGTPSSAMAWARTTDPDHPIDTSVLDQADLDLDVGVSGRAIRIGTVQWTGDYLADPRISHEAQRDTFVVDNGIHSVIAAPLILGGEPAGAITIYDVERDAFDEQDARTLQALADQAAVTITNARLIEQLERAREEVERRADAERTLRQIAANISAIRDSQVVLQQTVDEALRLLESRDARIDLLEDGLMVWRFTATNRDMEAFDTTLDTGFAVGEGIAGLVVRDGKPFRTGDYLAEDRFVHTPSSDAFVRETGMRSVIAAPMIGESGPLGVISVATDRPDAYDDTDAALLEALADQATIAIQNARLIEALERSQTDLAKRATTERALREMASAIAELREPDELLRRIVEETRRLLGSDGAHLTRISPDGTDLVPEVVAGDDDVERAWLRGLRFPVNAGINGLAAGQGEPVWTADYTQDDRIPLEPDDLDVARRMGLCGMASAPLRSPEGTVIGTLAVSYRTPHPFDPEEVAVLKSLADHAAIAVTNTTLYERLRQSQARYRHLVQNSPDIVWSVDAEARFTFVSATVERLTGWQPLELLGEHFGALIHESSREVAQINWTRTISVPNQELRGRVNLLHRDGHAIPAEFIAMASLDADGRFAGANGSVRDMTRRDALERDLRRQAAELAAGEERSHLARELHDSVTQALFSMTLLTRTIEMQLERNPDAARAQLVILRDLEREALAEMRALIFELRPGNLEQDGLIHALRTHSSALQGRIGLPIVVSGTELPDRLPIEIEEVLYRIAQEALHNVVKHAGAREAGLELEKVGDDVRLRIIDDGRGFDPERVPAGHLGLAGMRARAAKIGAELQVRSSTGSGTTVEVVVPAEAITASRERARASADQLEEERQTAAATSAD